ncbi:TerB family tellurite resistance protein [Pyruvatibacter mobilis]|uniref:tellurite resistance TerB family protein n=1 Tax=Pyruvatibacter mobilis TaxID=1712261 RepID=UPI003BAE2FEE
MIEALKQIFSGAATLPDEHTVAVGLLLEVIRMDDDFDDMERAAVARIVSRRFDVSEDEAMQSVAEVADMPRTTYDDAELLKAINEAYSPAQKTTLVESLWEIALADGELHRFENHAILAIANKLGMGQAELDATRAAAKARLAA